MRKLITVAAMAAALPLIATIGYHAGLGVAEVATTFVKSQAIRLRERAADCPPQAINASL